jgi:hypothetical protein
MAVYMYNCGMFNIYFGDKSSGITDGISVWLGGSGGRN